MLGTAAGEELDADFGRCDGAEDVGIAPSDVSKRVTEADRRVKDV